MAIAFSRSLRALNNDRFRPSLIVLSITLVLLAAWVTWFVFGSVPIYETSNTFSVAANGWLSVTFPADALARIEPNQKVSVQIQNDKTSTTYTGIVYQVAPTAGKQSGTAQVLLDSNQLLPQNLKGQVRVEIDKLSPLNYALRAVQQASPAP
ncbi:MAG TPA: HlyD family efflux transporter periplasmic adaptor subunit [Anaerolineae bacterium]|nr:HlyD family efflux transporter periplasmic adaptor subunit [Anaerolineae bacterium]